MYSTLKTTTLERKFPLLAVEQGCIVSKEADITVAFRVELPATTRLRIIAGTVHRCGRGLRSHARDMSKGNPRTTGFYGRT